MATKNQSSTNPWKIISLIFIALFAVLLIVSLVRFSHSRPPLTPATQEQMESAKAVVEQSLQANGYNISNYKIESSSEIGRIGENQKEVLRVTAENDTSRHFYIVDLETGKVVLQDSTHRYDWMAEMNPPREAPGGNFRGKPR